jgi:Family of unknown function (DUF6023)
MDQGRLRGAVIYAAAAVLLAAGALWYAGAAPAGPSPSLRLAAWRQAVARALPPVEGLVVGDAFELAAGATRQARAEEMPFAVYRVVMACAGTGRVRAQLGASGTTVRLVPCDGRPSPVEVRRGLSGDVILYLTADTTAPAVFGWQLIRPGG